MFDNVKRTKKKSTSSPYPPPLTNRSKKGARVKRKRWNGRRDASRATDMERKRHPIGSQIEPMESLSNKIWKSIDFYIVWKQDHPPKATKRVPTRARGLPTKSHSDKALTSTFFTLSRISHKANPLDVSRCICVPALFGFQSLRVFI